MTVAADWDVKQQMNQCVRFPTMCDEQSLRSACAYMQSDQSLCLSLGYSMSVKLLTEHHLEFLSLPGGCTGLSVSTLVKIPHCWKSHVAAQIIVFLFGYNKSLISHLCLLKCPELDQSTSAVGRYL